MTDAAESTISTYEPPLLEGILLERSHRPIVIGEILLGDVESKHRRVIYGLKGGEDEGIELGTQKRRYRYEPWRGEAKRR